MPRSCPMKSLTTPLAAALLAWPSPPHAAGKVTQPLFGPPLPDRRSALRQLHPADRHQDQPHRRQGRRTARAHPERGRQQPGRHLPHRRCRAPGQGRRTGPVRAGQVEAAGRAHSRQSAQPTDWFAFSTRARVIIYNKAAVKADDVQNYEDLANPQLKGKVCVRSGSPPLQPLADGRR